MRFKISLLLGFTFFILGVLTLPHYGINWDTINHLPRGQVYLRYFLTGKKDFSDLPQVSLRKVPGQWYWQNANTLFFDPDIPKKDVPRLSMYQRAGVDFNYFMERDGGHPPLSDILSSTFNLILFQKLGLVNDIDSYRIYGVLLAAALVGLVFWWTSTVYKSNFAGLVAALSLALYPLFWSESHFNTEKDVPETVFWGFLLFSVWKGVTGRSPRWLLLSGVFFGLALGTKFNVLFIPFVILPWLVVVLGGSYLKKKFRVLKAIRRNIKLIVFALVAPLIGVAIFMGSWPYLWPDPITRLNKVIGFYKGIGLTQNVDPRFLGPFGTSTFPLQWILYTTPLIILALVIVGIGVAVYRFRNEKDKISLLFLLWFAVPIARVVWPGTTVYGGIRQIMEYIPALAILAGLGAITFRGWLVEAMSKANFKLARKEVLASILILAAFIPITMRLAVIHPNENVYFNPLIGGLAGARERDLPFWGHTFGAPYRQGIQWINENAQKESKLVYAHELMPNIPTLWVRPDLSFNNQQRSGYLRDGEYVITLTSRGTETRSYYDMYLNRFIEPVYQVTVDSVPILKVWENDKEHLKVEWDEKFDSTVSFQKTDFGLQFDLGEKRDLSRLEISYKEKSCEPLEVGYVQISKDGQVWDRLPGNLPDDWRISSLGEQPKDGKFMEPFVGQEARFINLILSPSDTCLKQVESFRVYYLL